MPLRWLCSFPWESLSFFEQHEQLQLNPLAQPTTFPVVGATHNPDADTHGFKIHGPACAAQSRQERAAWACHLPALGGLSHASLPRSAGRDVSLPLPLPGTGSQPGKLEPTLSCSFGRRLAC